jgi:hypothetical protein
MLLAVFIWSLASWKAMGCEIFDPYGLFLISAFIFNAGQAFLEVFHLNAHGLLNGVFTDSILESTLAIVLLGLTSLHFGALAKLAVRGPYRTARRVNSSSPGMRIVGWILLVVSVPSTVVWLSNAAFVASGSGYAALYDRDVETGLAAGPLLLTGCLVPGLLLLTAVGRKYALERRLTAGLLGIFVIVQFYIGYRATPVMPLIAWAWLRNRAVKPIRPGLLIAVGTILMLIVFPLVRETRNTAFGERSFETVTRWVGIRENPGVDTISEMGGSMATVAYTLLMVPTVRSFSDGEDYAFALLTLVPNVMWDIHPTIAHGTNSEWLAATVYAGSDSRGAGLGFSFIAEAYVNFGPSGPLLVMAMFGFLVAGVSRWAAGTTDVGRLALVAIIIAVSLRFPRDELSGILRSVVWFGVLPYLAAILISDIALGAMRAVRTRCP